MTETKRFKLGQPVFYCNCYGTDSQVKTFRYGSVEAGFIMEEEYIEARDSYLYTVGTLSAEDRMKVHTKLLGPHMSFEHSPAGYFKAIAQVEEFCEEVEDED